MCEASQVLLLFIFLCGTTFSQAQKPKVAVVTGANKGIGYEIVKGLCEKYDGHVYLTSRDVQRGEKAVQKLKNSGLHPYYHQLDVTDSVSIQEFRDHINTTEGGIDILINNAAVSYSGESATSREEQVENIIKVNYFGLLEVSTSLFPILRHNARVVNIASALGVLSYLPSNSLRSKLSSASMTLGELNAIMHNYINSAKQGTDTVEGWPADSSPYRVSKIGVAALTFIQQRSCDEELGQRNISVNCVHPGYVDTDMTNHRGILSPEEGARAPLFLALENHKLHGQFLWNNFEVFNWRLSN